MKDVQKMLGLIGTCDDPEKLRSWHANALKAAHPDLAAAAFRRLIAILPAETPGTLEHDFWQTVHAFEHILKEERGKTVRLSRTRQMVARVGVVATLMSWAKRTTDTDGFTMLMERNMPELTGEAIVLRHASQFDPEVVTAARDRLERAGVNVAALLKSSGEL
ncbi:MAG: hypothetical protein KIT25_24890 [Enhydrobacter sp.]|nr:MAG: hypothetical protein KIT25_24890 [Enhydrobacter sp.]